MVVEVMSISSTGYKIDSIESISILHVGYGCLGYDGILRRRF